MPAELNRLPANGTANGINNNVNELSNPTPADTAFDSIADVIAAFGKISSRPSHHIYMND